MRPLLACVLALLVVLPFAAADDKKDEKKTDIDADNLVGKWATGKKPKVGDNTPVEMFSKDGKYSMGPASGKGPNLEGTYKLEGDKLTITMKGTTGVPGEVYKRTVKSLSDKELEYTEGKKSTTMTKVK